MELRQLRYLVAVADELNFTRASEKLRVAQPALSRQIRQLEDELAVQLFERDSRHVKLTPAGAAFVGEARALLQQSAKAIRAAQTSTHAMALNIGYVWGLFHSYVPGVIVAFRQENPETAVNLFDFTATQQVTALKEDRLDAGFIGFAHEADAAGLKKQQVGEATFVAALPKGHSLAKREKLPLVDLANEGFFLISEQTYPGASQLVLDAFKEAGFRPRILQTAERGHTILSLVAGGCGVALVPEPLRALPHDGVVFRGVSPVPSAGLFVAWRASVSNPARAAFLKSLPTFGKSLKK
jgi:DNA-binding transcriptional LysR family regulator